MSITGGSVANGGNGVGSQNGGNGGFAIGPGSQANGGGVALNGGDTHPGCNIALGVQCFNMPGR
ncbi:MAG TPA: hypothetical protein VEP90_28155 [Methylomirabilota bacterium]|nr:hypothetical protein [Methylomirabilota bacterium]